MGKQLKIVVVNLARSSSRRAAMVEQLEPLGLAYEFFEAIDGKTQNHVLFNRFDARMAEIRRGYTLTAGELGCYASHFILWQRCVEQNCPLLIFEDDVAINDNFSSAYNGALEKIEQYGLLRFSGHKPRRWVHIEKVANDVSIVRLKIGPLGASCYAISPSAARMLLETADVWFEPIDCHLDRFWEHGIKPFGFAPWPVKHIAEAATLSEIWQGKPRGERSTKFMRLRALYRKRDDLVRFLANIKFVGRWQSWRSFPVLHK